MTQITDEQLKAFTLAADAVILEHTEKNFSNLVKYHKPLEIMRGEKFARIVNVSMNTRSVFCFIDLSNGDILKAASWKAPAKHARGNIANGAQDVGPYGPAYLR